MNLCWVQWNKIGLWIGWIIGIGIYLVGSYLGASPELYAQPAPIEDLTFYRSRMILNGVWKFAPTMDGNIPKDETTWGYIWVPGVWIFKKGIPGIIKPGKGWTSQELQKYERGIFRTEIVVPQGWKDRSVILNLERVSTDAVIYVNGKRMGSVYWPGGEVDLTAEIQPGSKMILDILVIALSETKEVEVLMGVGANQTYKAQVTMNTRGIIGDVILESRPKQAWIDSIFIQPSVRQKRLDVTIEIGNANACEAAIVAQLFYRNNLEKTFTSKVRVQNGAQELRVGWGWENPRLWDIGKPELYTIKLRIEGTGIRDEYYEVFGFREIWVDGRKFFLNGTEFRLRPIHGHIMNEVNNCYEIAGYVIDGMLKAGFNIQEQWPFDIQGRGTPHWQSAWIAAADERGFGIMAMVPSVRHLRSTWDRTEVREKYIQDLKYHLRLLRNHPSVLIYVHSGNAFGHEHDQAPQLIGKRNWAGPAFLGGGRKAQVGLEANELIRSFDSTRPIFTHAGSYIGDIYSTNMYLNFIPLQEREEWLSAWVKDGEMPFLAAEFGTPLHCSFMRGRSDGGWGRERGATYSEPLMTEFSAIYLGNEAYYLERKDYRDLIRSMYNPKPENDQLYKNWQGVNELDFAPANQKIQELFIRNTWRAWRTMGVSGGMIPWGNAHSFIQKKDQVLARPFTPGQRGYYWPKYSVALRYFFQEEGWIIGPAGGALIENNQPTLAWIAGAPNPQDVAAFTSKDHSFIVGQTIVKQIVLINDERVSVAYHMNWRAVCGERLLSSGTDSGSLKVGEIKLIPIQIPLNFNMIGFKEEGRILLEAVIGERRHRDEFLFRVFSFPPKGDNQVVDILDPIGLTTKMLQGMGYQPRPISTIPQGKVLVIGRQALDNPSVVTPSIAEWVRKGGRLIIMAQTPEILQKHYGFRICRHISRRAFPAIGNHPVLVGLDAEDLRDWSGHSTLVPSYPPVDINSSPTYGWHWGNRGAVSSASIEKPHHSSWRPILENEFDMQYSPLMEMEYEQGLILLCQLDLEDHWHLDPVPALLVKRILDYASNTRLNPKFSRTVYFGNEKWKQILDSMGLIYQHVTKLTPERQLVIVAPDSGINREQMDAILSAGGHILVLPSQQLEITAGVTRKIVDPFPGSLSLPSWSETRGITVSDLRLRTDSRYTVLDQGRNLEIAADGLLGRIIKGEQCVIFCQIDPTAFDCKKETFHRYTRWHQTRALANLIANLGGTFKMDSMMLEPIKTDRSFLPLAGIWKIRVTLKLPEASSVQSAHRDPGVTHTARLAIMDSTNSTEWTEIQVPGSWESLGDNWKFDGEVVYRKEVIIPSSWVGKDLVLELGRIDDFDHAFFNGEEIGSTGRSTPNWYDHPRRYKIPARLVKPGLNVLTVRVFDHFGSGGLVAKMPEEMKIQIDGVTPLGFYHPDYRSDFDYGDDPYRYKRW